MATHDFVLPEKRYPITETLKSLPQPIPVQPQTAKRP